jgi:hypothetical protein
MGTTKVAKLYQFRVIIKCVVETNTTIEIVIHAFMYILSNMGMIAGRLKVTSEAANFGLRLAHPADDTHSFMNRANLISL